VKDDWLHVMQGCRHCHAEIVRLGRDILRVQVCPRAIHCAGAVLCLDCVLEAVKEEAGL